MGSTMTDKTEAQPEALRVAAWLINAPFKTTHGDMLVGGRELRRLHAETEAQAARIAELEAQLSARQAAPDEALRDALVRARDWFESQAKVVSKGCGSPWNLMQLRDERDAADAALSAAPPPPEREPLTDEQIFDIAENFKSQYAHGGVTFDEFDYLEFAGAIQRAHGIWRNK